MHKGKWGLAISYHLKTIGVGIEWRLVKGSDSDPKRAMQTAPPFQGLYPIHANPGLRPLRSLHPGLCCVALSALVSLGLMRMPSGA